MWERIAERLVAECKEMNLTCDKSAKQCRDKINNLSNAPTKDDSRNNRPGATETVASWREEK